MALFRTVYQILILLKNLNLSIFMLLCWGDWSIFVSQQSAISAFYNTIKAKGNKEWE
jgi:hypothetical protein